MRKWRKQLCGLLVPLILCHFIAFSLAENGTPDPSQTVSVSVVEIYEANPITIQLSGYALDDKEMGALTLACEPVDDAARDFRVCDSPESISAMKSGYLNIALIDYKRDFAAPVEAGEVMGSMSWLSNQGEVLEFRLVATRSVAARTPPPSIEDIVDAAPETSPELSFLSDEELMSLAQYVTTEMFTRGILYEYLYGGDFLVGEDIPAGVYVLEATAVYDNDYFGPIAECTVYDFQEDSGEWHVWSSPDVTAVGQRVNITLRNGQKLRVWNGEFRIIQVRLR